MTSAFPIPQTCVYILSRFGASGIAYNPNYKSIQYLQFLDSVKTISIFFGWTFLI